MQHIHNTAYEVLLKGGFITYNNSSGYRILDNTNFPVLKITKKGFDKLHSLLRKSKRIGITIYLINKSEVRKLNGNATFKKIYKKLNATP
jgi:hypothetical protein